MRSDSETTAAPRSRQHVVVFTGHFFPHVGGVERFSYELWRRMVERGWRVTLVTSNTDNAPAEEEIAGITVIRLPCMKAISGRLPIPLPSRQLLETVGRIRRDRPDAIVTNTRFFMASVLGMLLARRFSVPTLHIDHGSQHISLGNPVLSWLGELVDHTVGSWVLTRATRCVGVSRAVARFLKHLGRCNAGILYNGVDTELFGNPQENATWDQDAEIGSVILFVGRLIEDKGILVLLDAFIGANFSRNTHLIIAGDGHLKSQVIGRTIGNANIHVLGSVPPERVRALLQRADIVVHPSYYPEGLPTVLLEAGAAGRAIIATPVGGTQEIISQTDSGVIVPCRDVGALRNAMVELIQDDERRLTMGRNIQQRVLALFDWRSIVTKLEELLRELTDPYITRNGGER